jgi:hypothetical protein
MAVDSSQGVLEGAPAALGMAGAAAASRPARARAPRERSARPNEAMQQAVQLYNAGAGIHDIARQLVPALPP